MQQNALKIADNWNIPIAAIVFPDLSVRIAQGAAQVKCNPWCKLHCIRPLLRLEKALATA